MKYSRNILISFLVSLLSISYNLRGQAPSKIDSIEKLLKISNAIKKEMPDSAMLLAKEAWVTAESIDYPAATAKAMSRVAMIFKVIGEQDSAIKYFKESLNYRGQNELPISGIAGMHNWIGNVYQNKSLFEHSITHFNEALDIRKKLANKKNLEPKEHRGRLHNLYGANNNLAVAYKKLAERKLSIEDTALARPDLDLAIFYYKKSLDILKNQENFLEYATRSNMISAVYRMKRVNDSALLSIDRAIVIFDSLLQNGPKNMAKRYKTGLADSYTRKGLLYDASNQSTKATQFHLLSLESNKEISDSANMFLSLLNLGDNSLYLQQYSKSLRSLNEALLLVQAAQPKKEDLSSLYNSLAEIHKSTGNPEVALSFLSKSIILKTSISLENSRTNMQNSKENISLTAEVIQSNIEKDFQTKLNWWLISSGLLVTALLSIILYNSFQKQKYQKIIIENQEASHMQMLLSQLEEAEQQILSDQSAKQQMLLTAIGKELHDSIGSMLSAAKRELENLRNSLVNIPSKAESQFEHSYSMVDKAIRDLRKISKSPDKLSLDEQLVPSLRELCKNINQIDNSPQIELNTYRLEGVKLPAKHELHIFRIIQEAITNIIKHAQACEVHMQLDWADRILSITIEDNGIGFDPQQIKLGVGLDSMRSRTEELKGTFTLDTAPDKGCTLFMEIPIPG